MPKGIYKKIWGDNVPTFEERFWAKVKKTTNCWEWTGALFGNGYGHLQANHKNSLAHKISWEIHNGEIPKGLLVLHKCDNKKCIRPDHLFLGTHVDNMQDMLRKERGNKPKGEKIGISKLTGSQIRTIKTLKKNGNLSQQKIAEVFNVAQSTISHIVNGRTWKHI